VEEAEAPSLRQHQGAVSWLDAKVPSFAAAKFPRETEYHPTYEYASVRVRVGVPAKLNKDYSISLLLKELHLIAITWDR